MTPMMMYVPEEDEAIDEALENSPKILINSVSQNSSIEVE